MIGIGSFAGWPGGGGNRAETPESRAPTGEINTAFKHRSEPLFSMSIAVETHIEPLDIAPITGNKLSDAQLAKIDPEYEALHNRFLLGPRVQERPPHTFKRAKGSYVPGALGKVEVGSEQSKPSRNEACRS